MVSASDYDVFITADKNMVHQQDMTQYNFATLVLSTNDWKVIRDKVQSIRDALVGLTPGTVTYVECGEFIPPKHRK